MHNKSLYLYEYFVCFMKNMFSKNKKVQGASRSPVKKLQTSQGISSVSMQKIQAPLSFSYSDLPSKSSLKTNKKKASITPVAKKVAIINKKDDITSKKTKKPASKKIPKLGSGISKDLSLNKGRIIKITNSIKEKIDGKSKLKAPSKGVKSVKSVKAIKKPIKAIKKPAVSNSKVAGGKAGVKKIFKIADSKEKRAIKPASKKTPAKQAVKASAVKIATKAVKASQVVKDKGNTKGRNVSIASAKNKTKIIAAKKVKK